MAFSVPRCVLQYLYTCCKISTMLLDLMKLCCHNGVQALSMVMLMILQRRSVAHILT